jgi:hypothetical protein
MVLSRFPSHKRGRALVVSVEALRPFNILRFHLTWMAEMRLWLYRHFSHDLLTYCHIIMHHFTPCLYDSLTGLAASVWAGLLARISCNLFRSHAVPLSTIAADGPLVPGGDIRLYINRSSRPIAKSGEDYCGILEPQDVLTQTSIPTLGQAGGVSPLW